MSHMEQKLILCTISPLCRDYDDCEMSVEQIDVHQLWNKGDYSLREAFLGLITQMLRDGNTDLIRRLRECGYINPKDIEDRAVKLEAGKRFFFFTKRKAYGCNTEEFDISNIPAYKIDSLVSDDVQILQSITKTSFKKLLSKDQLKEYNYRAKQLRAKQEKQAAAAKKRRETSKKKKVDKARRLLEEAGEL